jgi:hypothetical protein
MAHPGRPKTPHGHRPEDVLAAAVKWFHACTDGDVLLKVAALDELEKATRLYIYLKPETN